MKNSKSISGRINADDIKVIVEKATSSQTGPDIYTNHVQVSISANDMVLDLYQIAPIIGKYSQIKATHIQRVIIPINMAKALSGAINRIIESFEKQTGVTILDSSVLPEIKGTDLNDNNQD